MRRALYKIAEKYEHTYWNVVDHTPTEEEWENNLANFENPDYWDDQGYWHANGLAFNNQSGNSFTLDDFQLDSLFDRENAREEAGKSRGRRGTPQVSNYPAAQDAIDEGNRMYDELNSQYGDNN